jgi:hypothetical protein
LLLKTADVSLGEWLGVCALLDGVLFGSVLLGFTGSKVALRGITPPLDGGRHEPHNADHDNDGHDDQKDSHACSPCEGFGVHQGSR